MIIPITGLRYHDINKIAEALVPKNMVAIRAEGNPAASRGTAYRIDCKGVTIGYINELATLRKWYREAKTEDGRTEKLLIGKAVRAVRDQFKIDEDNLGYTEWPGEIATILYATDEGWNSSPIKAVEFDEYSLLCQAGRAHGYRLRQVSINVRCVECF